MTNPKAKQDRTKTLSPPIPRADRFADLYLPLLIAAGTFLAFLPALKNQFLAWDDVDNFVNNTYFRGFGVTQLSWMFTTYHMGPYQPLSWLTSALDYTLWGMNPAGFHFTNILLHSLNGVLFYLLTRKILSLSFAERSPHPPLSNGRGEPACRQAGIPGEGLAVSSALAALFFTIHPLRVESVAWATERRDVLSGLFFLSACLCYLQRWKEPEDPTTERKYYWGTLFLFLLALLSKATAIGLIWALIALDVYPLQRLPLHPGRWLNQENRSTLLEKIPFLLLGAGAVINGVLGLSVALGHYRLIERLSFFIYGAAFYLRKTFWPGALSPLYELPLPFESMSGSFILCAGAALLITGSLMDNYQRSPAGLLAWLCYLLTFAPVSGLAQNGPQIVAARYSYLACLPWAVLLGGWLSRRRSLWLLMGLLLCALGWQTWNQTKLWRDDLTLWDAAVRLHPGNSRAHNNLGAALAKAGRTNEAMEHYQRALEINPTLSEAYRDVGLVLANLGKFEEALTFFLKANELRSNMPEVHVNMAAAYYTLGKLDESIEHYRRALELRTTHVGEIYSNLALALMLKGKPEEAIRYYEKAKVLRPELPQIHNNLASALAKVGRKDEAIAEARLAIQLNPGYAKAHFLLGTLLKERGEARESDEHLRKASQLGLGG